MGLFSMFGSFGVNMIAFELIMSCTLNFRALQFSIVYPGALEWSSHQAFTSYP